MVSPDHADLDSLMYHEILAMEQHIKLQAYGEHNVRICELSILQFFFRCNVQRKQYSRLRYDHFSYRFRFVAFSHTVNMTYTRTAVCVNFSDPGTKMNQS